MTLSAVPASEPLPLDVVGSAAAAYGLRKLSRTYAGPLVRVRESGGNTLLDIDANANGDLDLSALLAHVGSNDGFVETWYDQSGNGADLVQATSGSQPQIVASGAAIKNLGTPSLYFPQKYLDATLASAVSNDAVTIVAACQSATALVDTSTTLVMFGPASWTSQVTVIENTQRWQTRASAGGSISAFNDPDNLAMVWSRKTIISVRQDGQDARLYRNHLLRETATFANTGADETIMRFGNSGAGQSCYIGEAIVYGSALGDAQLLELYYSINAYHRTGPDSSPDAGGPIVMPWDGVLLKWIASLDTEDLDVPYAPLEWDETYDNNDQLFNRYVALAYDGLTTRIAPLTCSSQWFMLNDSEGRGIGGDDVYRMMFAASPASPMAALLAMSLPNGGSEGNPYYQHRGVAYRCAIIAALNLIQWNATMDDAPSVYTVTDFTGGALMGSAYSYRQCRHLLPMHVRQAMDDLVWWTVYRLTQMDVHGVNSNMDMKAVAAIANCYLLIEDSGKRAAMVGAVKQWLFGSPTGTPATSTAPANAVYSPAGHVLEGLSPETTYNGHSFYWLSEAYSLLRDFPEWSFLGTVMQDGMFFKQAQYFIEPDDTVIGPSGYAGRTGGSRHQDQGTATLWVEPAWADSSSEGRFNVTSLPSTATMVAAISSGLATHNARIAKGATQITGTCHTNGVSTTVVQLVGSPDLSALPTGEGVFRWWIRISGTWHYSTTFDNTAKTVTIDQAISIASGSPENYVLEFGPRDVYNATNRWWPDDEPFFPSGGFYDAQLNRINTSDATLDTVWQSSTAQNVSFNEEFWLYKQSDGSRDWGFFVEAMENPGGYTGWYGGTLQAFWTRTTGCVILSRHDKSGSEVGENENTRVDAEYDTRATTEVWGVMNDDSRWYSANTEWNYLDPVDTLHATVWDLVGSPPSVSCEFTFGAVSGYKGIVNGASAVSGEFVVRNTFEALSDGVRHLVEVEHTGSDTIKEMWATIPVYLRDTSQAISDTQITYWTGASWSGLTTAIVEVSYVRLRRDFGSGPAYVWIEFVSPTRVRLADAVYLQTYQGATRHRNIRIDLHGNPGTGISWPAAVSTDYSIVTTDPGLTQTEPSIAVAYPTPGEVFPETGIWGVQASVEWVSSAGTVVAEYTTNGSTWNSIGTMSNVGGDVYEFVGGSVPASVVGVRVRATPPSGSEGTAQVAVTSDAYTLVFQDDFTASNGTSIDGSYTAWTTNTTGNAYLTPRGAIEVQSNAASATTQSNGAQRIIDCNSYQRVMVECVATQGTGEGLAVGPQARVTSDGNMSITAGVMPSGTGYTFRLVEDKDAGLDVDETFNYGSYSVSNPYRILLQCMGSFVAARFVDITNGNAVAASIGAFNATVFTSGSDYHGWIKKLGSTGSKIDEVKIWVG